MTSPVHYISLKAITDLLGRALPVLCQASLASSCTKAKPPSQNQNEAPVISVLLNLSLPVILSTTLHCRATPLSPIYQSLAPSFDKQEPCAPTHITSSPISPPLPDLNLYNPYSALAHRLTPRQQIYLSPRPIIITVDFIGYFSQCTPAVRPFYVRNHRAGPLSRVQSASFCPSRPRDTIHTIPLFRKTTDKDKDIQHFESQVLMPRPTCRILRNHHPASRSPDRHAQLTRAEQQ